MTEYVGMSQSDCKHPMTIVPKSAEEVKKELLELYGKVFAAGGSGAVMPSNEIISTVKSALASHLLWAAEEAYPMRNIEVDSEYDFGREHYGRNLLVLAQKLVD